MALRELITDIKIKLLGKYFFFSNREESCKYVELKVLFTYFSCKTPTPYQDAYFKVEYQMGDECYSRILLKSTAAYFLEWIIN